MANGIPLLQNSLSFRIEAGPNYGARDFDLMQIFNSIQTDLNNILTYLATHQHSALNAAPATGTFGSSGAVAGASLLSTTPGAVPGAAANSTTLYIQP